MAEVHDLEICVCLMQFGDPSIEVRMFEDIHGKYDDGYRFICVNLLNMFGA